MRIDLNADVGEIPVGRGSHDAELMHSVTSASIAAGVHAGDALSIRATIDLARVRHVAVGVHPSLADREGFGRRELPVDLLDVERIVLEQIVAVASAAADAGVELQHVKPHGALYNMAARDPQLAAAVVRAIAVFDRGLALYGPSHSHLIAAGRRAGLKTVAEVFADRTYTPDGLLVSRGVAGAVLHDLTMVVQRAVRMATERTVEATDGSVVHVDPETLCIHGDTEGAGAMARAVRSALEAAHVTVRAPGRL